MRRKLFDNKALAELRDILDKYSGIISVKIKVNEKSKRKLGYGSDEFTYLGKK